MTTPTEQEQELEQPTPTPKSSPWSLATSLGTHATLGGTAAAIAVGSAAGAGAAVGAGAVAAGVGGAVMAARAVKKRRSARPPSSEARAKRSPRAGLFKRPPGAGRGTGLRSRIAGRPGAGLPGAKNPAGTPGRKRGLLGWRPGKKPAGAGKDSAKGADGKPNKKGKRLLPKLPGLRSLAGTRPGKNGAPGGRNGGSGPGSSRNGSGGGKGWRWPRILGGSGGGNPGGKTPEGGKAPEGKKPGTKSGWWQRWKKDWLTPQSDFGKTPESKKKKDKDAATENPPDAAPTTDPAAPTLGGLGLLAGLLNNTEKGPDMAILKGKASDKPPTRTASGGGSAGRGLVSGAADEFKALVLRADTSTVTAREAFTPDLAGAVDAIGEMYELIAKKIGEGWNDAYAEETLISLGRQQKVAADAIRGIDMTWSRQNEEKIKHVHNPKAAGEDGMHGYDVSKQG